MAERRMFAKTIIDSDAFIDMPVTARLLYYDLAMRADDDGFVNSPKKIMRMIGASQDDLSVLILKKFIIPFDNGVVVIKHWRIHNYIRKDTYNETTYKEEKELLEFDENHAYRLAVDGTSTDRPRIVDDPSTQVRLGKDRLGKDRIDNKDTCKQVLAESGLSKEVSDTVEEFIRMRKLIKSPMTPKALRLMIGKLRGMSEDPETQIAILNQSIENSWKGIYPLKNEAPAAGRNKAADALDESYRMIARWAEGDEDG